MGSGVKTAARFLLAAAVTFASVAVCYPSVAEEVLSNRLERRRVIKKKGELHSLEDARPPAVTDKATSREARVQDSQTLRIGTTLYHLWGVAAPGLNEFGGYTAMQGLAGLIDDATVTCTPTGLVINGIFVARCVANGADLSARMVEKGLARDCPRQSGGTYAELERQVVATVAGGFDLPEACGADD